MQPWIRKLANHFWHCSQACEEDAEKFAGNLLGVLHHIVDEHEWLFTVDGREGKCDHGPLEEQAIAFLEPGSPGHEKLHAIIMDRCFLKTLPYYKDFRKRISCLNIKGKFSQKQNQKRGSTT